MDQQEQREEGNARCLNGGKSSNAAGSSRAIGVSIKSSSGTSRSGCPAVVMVPQLQVAKLRETSSSRRAGAGAGAAAAAAAAPVLQQLRDLRLHNCRLPLQLASELLSATTLTKLQWQLVTLHSQAVSGYGGHWARQLTPSEVQAHLWQWVQQLPHLSELQLGAFSLQSGDVSPLSNLQDLRSLTVQLNVYSGQSTVARELLTALQHLTQLQHLELRQCRLHLAQPQPQQEGASSLARHPPWYTKP